MSKTNHLTRLSHSIWAQADRETKASAQTLALRWLEWKCQRDGIALPAKPWRAEFLEDDGVCEAVLIEKFDSRWHGPQYEVTYGPRGGRKQVAVYRRPQELMRVAVPAWAMPVKRADLWHAAHQAGLPLADCADEGAGYSVREMPDVPDPRERARLRLIRRERNKRRYRLLDQVERQGFTDVQWNRVATWFPLPIAGRPLRFPVFA